MYIKTHAEKLTVPETWACQCTSGPVIRCLRMSGSWGEERNVTSMVMLCSSHVISMVNTEPGRFICTEICRGLQISWLGSSSPKGFERIKFSSWIKESLLSSKQGTRDSERLISLPKPLASLGHSPCSCLVITWWVLCFCSSPTFTALWFILWL